MNNIAIIVIVAVVAALLLLLLLVRGRKQKVAFSDTPPLPHSASIPSKPDVAAPPATEAPVATPAQDPMRVAQPATGDADNLTSIKGLGPKAASLLNGLGITRFDQIANWNDAEVAAVDAQMGNFKGRIVRDRWVDQARLLAKGDKAAFEAEFGKLAG